MNGFQNTAIKFAYSLQEVGQAVGLGRTKVYAEAREGRLRISKIGRRSIVLADDLADYLARVREGASKQGAPSETPTGLFS